MSDWSYSTTTTTGDLAAPRVPTCSAERRAVLGANLARMRNARLVAEAYRRRMKWERAQIERMVAQWEADDQREQEVRRAAMADEEARRAAERDAEFRRSAREFVIVAMFVAAWVGIVAALLT